MLRSPVFQELSSHEVSFETFDPDQTCKQQPKQAAKELSFVITGGECRPQRTKANSNQNKQTNKQASKQASRQAINSNSNSNINNNSSSRSRCCCFNIQLRLQLGLRLFERVRLLVPSPSAPTLC